MPLQQLHFAAAHYHTNTSNPVGSRNLFNSLSVRQEQLLQDAGSDIDAEFSYNFNLGHSLRAPNFFGALNGYNTDEEEDIKQLSGGFLGADEYSVDSSDDDTPEPALFITRGMEDVPPPPSWRQDAAVSAKSLSSHAPQDSHSSFPAHMEPLQTPAHDAADLRRHAHADASPGLSDGNVPADDVTAFQTPWRSAVATGTAPPPDVDARQAMRDSLRQRASQQVVQTAGDALEEHLTPQLYPEARSFRFRRPRLPTTPMRQPRPDPDAQQGRSVALSVLAEGAEPDGATMEELEDLVALVSPCSAAVAASERRLPYASVNPVCEHQTWNLFNSAAAGLLSTAELRTVARSVRATLGLPESAATPPAAAEPREKPQVRLFQECWQDAVTASQMQYIAESLRRTGRVPLTRPRDDAHAQAAVSVHQDIAVTDRALKKFEESSCWGEVERCAAEITAEAAAAEAAAEAAEAARAAAVIATERSYDSSQAGPAAEAGDERAQEKSAHAAGVWGAGVYGGVGVPLRGGVPTFAIVSDGPGSDYPVGADGLVSGQVAEVSSSVGAVPSSAGATAVEVATSSLVDMQGFSAEDVPAEAIAVQSGGPEAGAGCGKSALAGLRGRHAAADGSSASVRRPAAVCSRKVPRRKMAVHGGAAYLGLQVPQGSTAAKKLCRKGRAGGRLHMVASAAGRAVVGDACASVRDASAADRSVCTSDGGSAVADAADQACAMHAAPMADCGMRGRDSGECSDASSCSGGVNEAAARAYAWTSCGVGFRDGVYMRAGLQRVYGQREREDQKACT